MDDSSESTRGDYNYTEVKALLGNDRFPRTPVEEQAFALERAHHNGQCEGRLEVISFIEVNFLNIENPVWLICSQAGRVWESKCREWRAMQ